MSKEIWSKVDEGGFYEGLYEVSNLGRWKMLPRILPTGAGKGWRKTKEKIIWGYDRDRYRMVQLKKDKKTKHIDIHILVAKSFIPNPDEKPEVNHIDGCRWNNRVENLEWVTKKENAEHAWKTGLSKASKGEERSFSKLNDDKVRKMRALYKTDQYSMRALAKIFGVCATTVRSILDREKWKHVV